uniref:H-type lectin domain-containing protein n=1 Tax=Magnetococcus massalia (strain MO-1) TaxID=451514 RepID=A0A1S7LCX1_MAGMO|nr:Conserved exported protein of unknown function [Candidatus Magnetococcus massalia]
MTHLFRNLLAFIAASVAVFLLLALVIWGVGSWQQESAQPTGSAEPSSTAQLPVKPAPAKPAPWHQALAEQVDALKSQQGDVMARLSQLEGAQKPPQPRLYLQQGVLKVSRKDRGWKLLSVFSKTREQRRTLRFTHPFVSAPQVMVALQGLAMKGKSDFDLAVKAENITPQQFELVITTHTDVRIERAQLQWIALGEQKSAQQEQGAAAAEKSPATE